MKCAFFHFLDDAVCLVVNQRTEFDPCWALFGDSSLDEYQVAKVMMSHLSWKTRPLALEWVSITIFTFWVLNDLSHTQLQILFLPILSKKMLYFPISCLFSFCAWCTLCFIFPLKFFIKLYFWCIFQEYIAFRPVYFFSDRLPS